mmetsp:Transcript_31671/g.77650  ORF Transcript_31671/g.77650 Transcript_31671/m.77650 type:complete len:326 (+) Transcript_31671:286-1263(+)
MCPASRSSRRRLPILLTPGKNTKNTYRCLPLLRRLPLGSAEREQRDALDPCVVVGHLPRLPRHGPRREPLGLDHADEEIDRQRRRADQDAHDPLLEVEGRAPHGRVDARHLHHQELEQSLHAHDDEEVLVVKDAREDVDLAVDLARVDLVEELQHHEGREDDGVVLRGQLLLLRRLLAVGRRAQRHLGRVNVQARVHVVGARVVGVKERRARDVEPKHVLVEGRGAAGAQRAPHVRDLRARHAVVRRGPHLAHVTDLEDEEGKDDELPQPVPEHEAKHPARQQRLVARVRSPREQVRAGVLRGECKRGERVHDHIDPQQLDHVQR